jgi:pyridoxine 4-dehydrogenase
MTATKNLGGTFTFSGTSTTVHRLGYGAMQLAGPNVFGPPKDMEAALGVLRDAVEAGIDHIDTSDIYGPHITNQIIKDALHPYPQNLTIATKVGSRRGEDGSWIPDRSPASIRSSVEDNLRNLKLDSLHLVNLRVGGLFGPTEGSIVEPLSVLESMQRDGLIQHIGLSNISPQQFEEGREIAKIVCVQNYYNVAHRADDTFIDQLEVAGVAYVPFFPLGGGFSPVQSSVLDSAATSLKRTPFAVALAWLLQRASNILLIPGTSSAEHLRENIEAASLVLPEETMADLNAIWKTGK